MQEAYGLPSTGNANIALQEIICRDCHRPLKKGQRGKARQPPTNKAQASWAITGGKISGNYLDGTTAAVGHFRADNGLDKTGNAGRENPGKAVF